jgi:hypothetical protein
LRRSLPHTRNEKRNEGPEFKAKRRSALITRSDASQTHFDDGPYLFLVSTERL